jgi:hypothetical protein
MKPTRWQKLAGGATLLLVGLASLSGCGSSSTEAQAAADQQKTLNDPMGYSPNMDATDITGGGIGAYDDKAMKRDLNDVLNP